MKQYLKEQEITPPVMRELERVVLLRVVDEYLDCGFNH